MIHGAVMLGLSPTVLLALLLVPGSDGSPSSATSGDHRQAVHLSDWPLEGMLFSRIPSARFVMGSPEGERDRKAPNPRGLHDMLGNVFEWVSDWRSPYSADSLHQNARYTSGFRLVRDPQPQELEGVDAVDYIRSSLEAVPVVVLGEGGHQAKAPHEFHRRLLGDPSILAVVDAIIVEFANARYQSTLDAYIAGEDVPFDSLSMVWRNTGASPIAPWDSPVYAELLEVIRDGNRGLGPRERARVIGGDPDVDWERILTREDFLAAQTHRDPYVAELAMDLVFRQNKKVLILFGGVHLPRAPMGPGDPRNSLTFRILEAHPGTVSAFEFLSPDRLGVEDRMSELVRGRAYSTHDHWAGELEAGGFFPGVFAPVTDPETGDEGMRPITLYPEYRIKDLFDALIYIGPSNEWGRVPSFYDPVRDEAYLAELNRRSLLRFGRPFQSDSGNGRVRHP